MELSKAERDRMSLGLGKILNWDKKLNEVDTSHFETILNRKETNVKLPEYEAGNYFKPSEVLDDALQHLTTYRLESTTFLIC